MTFVDVSLQDGGGGGVTVTGRLVRRTVTTYFPLNGPSTHQLLHLAEVAMDWGSAGHGDGRGQKSDDVLPSRSG